MKRWWHKFAPLSVVLLAPLTSRGAVCTASANQLQFGTYSGAQLTPTTTLATNCPASVNSYTVGLMTGTGSGATTTTRKLTGPSGATLNYQIFQNSTHTSNWGDTVLTDTVTEASNTGSNRNPTAFALMGAGQAPTPGSYTDTMTIQIESSLGIQTGTFTVTATVQASCTLSATPLAFGSYSGSLIAVQSSIMVTCTNTTPYNVGLNQGTATGATVSNRSMTGPSSNLLGYQIHQTSGITNWGNTVGTDTKSGTGNGLAQSLTVFGSLTAGQNVLPGSYADTITATVTY